MQNAQESQGIFKNLQPVAKEKEGVVITHNKKENQYHSRTDIQASKKKNRVILVIRKKHTKLATCIITHTVKDHLPKPYGQALHNRLSH